MRESHACGLKTSISRIKDNFSRLTHKSGRAVLKKLHFISDLLCIIFLLFITIAKAFKRLQSVWIVSAQKSSEYLRTFSVSFASLRKIIGNLQKWLGRFRKSRSWRDKNLTRLTQKSWQVYNFRCTSSRMHRLRGLSHLWVLLGLQCTKTLHLIAARMTKNVGAFSLSLSILHCRELFVRHAIQCPGYFRGVEEGENVNCLITEHEDAQGNNNNNN